MIEGVSRNKFNHCGQSFTAGVERRTGDRDKMFGSGVISEEIAKSTNANVEHSLHASM